MDKSGEASETHLVLEPKRHFKILFVGDSDCGKTRIIQTYFKVSSPETLTQMYSTYEYALGSASSGAKISLVDVLGTCDSAMTSQDFYSTNVAIFCYAIDNVRSLENLRNYWIPGFRKYFGYKVPTILVGNKRDLRTSDGLRSSVSQQARTVSILQAMKTKIFCGMDMFLECSTKDYESIYCLFQAAHSYVL